MAGRPVSFSLDAQGAQSVLNPERGIARYIREHVDALVAVAPEALHSVALNPKLPLPPSMDHLLGADLLRWSDPRGANGARPDVFHIMSPFELGRPLEEIWPRWARRGSVRTVVTLYDLIPLVFPETYLHDPRIRAPYTARLDLLRSADHLVALSETTKRDAVEHLGMDSARISVVGAGVSGRLAELVPSRALGEAHVTADWPEVRPGFVLYVGGIEFRKNLEGALEGYGRLDAGLREAHQLVISCRATEDQRAHVYGLAREAGIAEKDVVLTGYVTDLQLAALYRACELFFFPSLYEGFGLPIVEAMSCDAPVVASAPLAEEVLGDTGAAFDPRRPEEIAASLTAALTEPGRLELLRERSRERVGRFTWESVAHRTVAAYEAAAESGRRARPPAKPRVALVTPWPREASGVADYNRRLLPELLRYADVDVVVGGYEPKGYDRQLQPGARLITARQHRFSRELRAYDRVVYCLGNSPLHLHVYRALLETPGVVMAHDARLTGLYWLYALLDRPQDPDWYLSKLRELYGGREIPLDELNGFGDSELEAARQYGVFMTGEIQALAEKVIVHSRHGAEACRLDAPEAGAEVKVVPFGVPAPVERTPKKQRGPLVVSAGVLHQIKGLEALLAAFKIFSMQHIGAKLIVAGMGIPDEVAQWRRRARELAPMDDVEITGWVPARRYRELLASADLAVQLRRHSNGEASASVCDCIAAGVPTIVSDLGWYSELPPDTVVRVPVDAAPATVAQAMSAVLGDAEERERLVAGQRRFAEENSFARVAESLAAELAL